MSQEKIVNSRLKSTLEELDSSIEQWDRLTNKPLGEQDTSDSEIQKKTKELLKELENQINEFDSIQEPKN